MTVLTSFSVVACSNKKTVFLKFASNLVLIVAAIFVLVVSPTVLLHKPLACQYTRFMYYEPKRKNGGSFLAFGH